MIGGMGFTQILIPHPFPPPKPSSVVTPPRITQIKSNNATVAAKANEIRVCTNRTCRRQGSVEVLQILSGIAPPDISVNSCGCLGRCGAGPNLVILPSATFVNHCATASRAAEVMAIICGYDSGSWKTSLQALSLRKKAEVEMGKGDFAAAEILLSQAIDLNPVGGIHFIYKERSVARLAMNKTTDALGDAVKASTLAPKYPEAYICGGDALMAMEQFEAAGDSYSMAFELDPSIHRSRSFKARIAKFEEKVSAQISLDF